jgi:hypothetical protein
MRTCSSFDKEIKIANDKCMGIFGLMSSGKKGKGKKNGKDMKINKSAKKKAKTCEFC